MMQKVGIYQIAFDDNGLRCIDPEFIRYFNNRKDQFFENNVLIDIYKSNRYKLFDYVGVLSWRFTEKTDLNGTDVLKEIDQNRTIDLFNFSPHSYRHEQHPYNRERLREGERLAQMIDDRNILPFNLFHYDTEGLLIWCNYFVCKKDLFALYIEKYLLPLVKYLSAPDDEIKQFIQKEIHHRDGGRYTIVPFFLEGLVSVFAHRERLKVKTI
jgi:hypothetical protein